MKNIIQILTLALIIMVAVSCKSKDKNESAGPGENTEAFYPEITIESDSITATESTYVIDISYPRIISSGDSVVAKKLNLVIERSILSKENEFLKLVKEYGPDQNPANWMYELHIGFAVSYNKNGILSLYTETYEFTGGAHGNTVREAFNFDTKTGERLSLYSIFKDVNKYKTVFNSAVSDSIKRNQDFFGDYEGIKEDNNFLIGEDGITIFFGLYEIAPYSSGIPEFTISKDKFSDILTEKYKDRI